ncbi:hypothetical protein O181_012003 [Austropuccinia psidii MF-1]|uniref:Glucosidase 2 subunit beta n=1 Tax=Austropuccinia psidii MF-1 TaxID=1389203 RepID=A0A9Q3BWC8_9BASI|nr:hypothetical protein [Austropuccinia psidii MF-1]
MAAPRWNVLALVVFFWAYLILPSQSVKRGDFKTCQQAGFCNRARSRSNRAASPEYSSTWKSPYIIRQLPVWSETHNALQAILVNDLYPGIAFGLNVTFVAGSEGTLRIKLDEINGLRQRYNEADRWTLVNQPRLLTSSQLEVKIGQEQAVVIWTGAQGHQYQFTLQYHPLLITLLKDSQPHILLNERGLFNMEHFRAKSGDHATTTDEGLVIQQSATNNVVAAQNDLYPGFKDTSEEGMWEETFGGRTDQKPKGPESLALDITFPGYSHVYGIPEHASPLSLKTTRASPDAKATDAYTDPYRLWNLDVFEYEHDSEMALYGAIPFMKAHRAGSTVGVFWLNAAETWIDIEKEPTKSQVTQAWKSAPIRASSDFQVQDFGPTDQTTTTHWISESGILDLFIFLGPSSQDIFSSFGALVGTTAMPPYFAIAYHQCRWNYVSQEDLLAVIDNFDKHDIPLDVIWLDIEYADEHKYFVWDKKHFPDPMKMIREVESTGRKLVTIVDPHIKRSQDLYVYKEAADLDVLVKLPDGSEYEGWCWTGSSSWVDYFNPKSWDWWSGLFKFNKYQESTPNVHNWLDMNEPSVFNAPEITMPRDNIHFGGWEHRDLHNLNGMATLNQSARGLRERTNPPMRGFVLSRSFFAGTQRYGAIWQGDNMGTWDHLAVSIPMLLSNGIAGMAFNGADVGGFFGNPSLELLVRWYQTGAFFPFFRAHAHIDTKRREPYLFDEPIRTHVVDMIKLRYTLLPTWYTLFFENSITGAPMAVPQYVLFPNDALGFAIDDQFHLGSSGLLVKPITKEGVTSTQVYIADEQPYYNYFTYDLFAIDPRDSSSKKILFPAPLDTVPLFIRGGHIVARRELVRRAAPLMWKDPITLVIALDKDGLSVGTLYMDDGESFNHERGQFIYRSFSIKPIDSRSFSISSLDAVGQTLKSSHEGLRTTLSQYDPKNPWAKKMKSVTVDKIIVLGLPERPTCVQVVGQSSGLHYTFKAGLASKVAFPKLTGLGKQASILEIKNADLKVVDDWTINIKLKDSCPTDQSSSEVDPLIKFQSNECPQGYFQCKNIGHIPSCIRISRVNDGICEPQCCDGSDEAGNEDVNCPNRCEAAGAEFRLRREKLMRKFNAGNSERKTYIAYGQKEQVRLKELIKSLKIEMISLKAHERDAKAQLEKAEKSSEAESNQVKKTNLYRRITGFQSAITSLRKKNEKLQKDLDQLSNILTDLKAGYNPNYQDMVVKGAVKGFEEWESSEDSTEATETADAQDIAIPPNEELDDMTNEDPVGLITSEREVLDRGAPSVDSNTISTLEQYLPESLKSSYEALREFLLVTLAKVGILPKGSNSSRGSSEHPDIVKARTAHQNAENALSKASEQVDQATLTLSKDWGKEWEFKKLDQTCLEMNQAEYVYEICLFGEAYQKSTGGGRTSLGKFDSWNKNAPQGSPDYYTKQVYLNGAKCWNGPERSVKLDLKCGTKNQLYSVMEPEKCEYWFKVTTPAVCRDGLDEESSKHDPNVEHSYYIKLFSGFE